MKEKICLFLKVFCMTTLFVVSVSCGLFTKNAFADDKFITGGPGTCTVDVLGVSDDSAFVKVIAVYLPQQYTCVPGTYLHVTETEAFCDDCPLNSYCPGGTFSVEDTYLGQNLCPDNYITVSTNSTSPSDCLPDSYCEWECTTPDCTPCGPSDIDGFIAVTPLMEAGDTFKFDLTAGGEFIIDWGDGTVENVEKRTGNISLQHAYQKPGQYRIKISGNASGYAANMPAISFQCKDDTGEYIVEHPLAGIEGSLGRVFPTINGVQPLFTKTFYGCDKVQNQTLPEYLFAGIKGKPAAHMFDSTFAGMTSLTEIPEKFTFGVSGAPADYVFANTFKETNISSIPEDLFLRIFGAPADGMFRGTFAGTQIESIPAEIFKGISGSKNTPIGEYAFANTFENTPITEIPEGLFENVKGAPSKGLFYATFKNTYITKLPETGMFPGISGAPAESMFDYTFANTPISNIPEDLFSKIEGSPAPRMFASTFEGCDKIEQSIPGALFGGIGGGPASGMFNRTFFNASKLLEWIPTNLFEKLQPFTNTGVVSDEIEPMGDIFLGSGITTDCKPYGKVQYFTGFEEYFDYKVSCTDCPANSVIFNGQCMCNDGYWVFDGTEILENTFVIEKMGAGKKCVPIPEYTITYECGDGTVIEGSVTSANVTHGSEYTVSGAMCDKINEIQTGWKLKDTNSTYDFSHVINNVTSDFVFTAQYKEKDISKYPFWFEVVPVEYVTNEVDIEISAKGTFKINWGDGSVETIDNENANAKQITHKYSFDKNDPDKTYIVRVGGWATGYAYNSNDTQEESVIKIACDVDSPKVTAAGGDIMDIFPRVNGYVQPSFKNMFSTCVHLEDINGDINEEGREKLTFNIVGKPRAYMFEKTFRDTDLTSIPYGLFRHSGTDSTAPGLFAGTFAYTLIEEIPYDLFYEIEGAPAEAMFQSTFSNTPIKSIPGNLFSKINGAPAKNMFMGTFANTKIGEIPGNLFSGIKGAPAEGMFQSTFSNTLIKSIPGNLFSKIKGAPAEAMFQSTFSNTLIKSIPYDLFSGIEGAPAKNMFKQTFMNCKNIESQIPEDLFKGIKGNLAEGSFYQTFAGIVPSIYYTEERPKYPDTNETPNFIPKGLFDDLSGATDENNAMTNVFGSTYNNNGNLEFSGLLTRCPKEFKRVETIFDDYFKHADDENPKVVCDECTEEYSTQGKDDTVCACIDGYAPSRLANDHGWIYCDTGDGSEDLLDKTLNEGDSCEPILHTIKYVCEGVEPYYTHEYKNHDDYFEEYNYDCDKESEHIKHSGWVDEYGNVYDFGEQIDWEIFPDDKYLHEVKPTYKLLPEFIIHTQNGTSGPVDITIRAKGTFYIDWGDGSEIQTVSDGTHTYEYSNQGQYIIGISGDATGYPTPTLPSISFSQTLINAIEYVDGSLGDIFPTIDDVLQPNFQAVFKDAKNMKAVRSDNLFRGLNSGGVYGIPIAGMFKDTFSGCENLEFIGDHKDSYFNEVDYDYGADNGLFDGITGLAESVFEGTFRNCKKLEFTTNPFPRIDDGADYAFKETFMGCTNLKFLDTEAYSDCSHGRPCPDYALPPGMFAGILPAKGMFQDTFKDCWYLQGQLPGDLFGGAEKYPKLELAQDMFNGTFAFCERLSGQIPKTLFGRFTGDLAEGVFAHTFQNAGFDLWVPKELFINFNNNLDEVPTAMTDIFVDSDVATDCEPYGLTQYITGFESEWSERVSCQNPSFILDYNCNGGDMAYTDPHVVKLKYTQNVTYDEQYTVKSGDLCTRDGYTFEGWYYDDYPEDELDPGEIKTYNYKTDKTLYAKWERNSYISISLDSHLYIQTSDGSGYVTFDPDVSANPGTLYTDVGFPDWYTDKNLTDVFSKLTQIPKKNGYIFRGFTTNKFATNADPLVISNDGSIIPGSITINDNTTLYASYTKCGCGTGGLGVESCTVKGTTDDNKCELEIDCKPGFYRNENTYVSESSYFVPTCGSIPKITVKLDSNYYATADATTGDPAEVVSMPTTLYLDPGKAWYHSIKSPGPGATIGFEQIIQLRTLPSYHTQTTNYDFRGFYTGKAGTGTQIIDSSGNFITTSAALNAFGSDTSISAQTIYAYYVPRYNITYSCGLPIGTPPPEQSVVFNTKFEVQQNDTCAMPNNHFVNWKVKDTEEILQPGAKVMYTYNSDITLVAQYENNKYFIVYDSNKGEGVIEDAVYECVAGTPCIVPENTYTRDGFYSIGWTCKGHEKCETGIILKKGDDLDSILITGKNGEIITLIAEWRKIGQFEINYNSAGGRGEDPSLVFCDGANDLTPENPYTNCLTPENPYTKDGYVFSRWEYTTNTGKSAYIYPGDDLSGLIEEDLSSITLTAVWDGMKIYYNYYDSGNILENMKPKYCISGSACPAPNIPYEKEGYIFEGWKCSSDKCTDIYKEALILPNNTNLTEIIDMSKVSDGDVIDLHAVWKPITFFINYDGNGNTGGAAPTEPVSCDYDEECNAPSNTYEKTGYKFVGWLCSGEEALCAGKIINTNDSLKNASLVDAGNIYLTAQWAPAEFTVVYDVAGGTPEIATQNCIYGQDCLVSDIKPEKSGYTFDNWTCSDDLNGVVCNGATILPSDNISTVGIIDGVVITLTATYTPITYTITYNANGGDGKMESSVFTYGVAGTLSPNTFTRTNYNFVGWAKTSDATVPEYADQAEVIDWSNVNGDIITLYAVWQEIPAIYTITYHANGGTGEMAQSTFNMDVEYSLPLNEFTRTGYTFKHWATNSDGSGNTYTDGQNVINLTTTRGANVDLYAVWKVAVCTDYNGSVLKRCDDPIMSSQEMIESGILESKSESEYKITNFDKYMRNQKWAVNFPTYGEGTGTISGSAFCGPVDKAEYGTVVKSIEDTPVADAILKQAHAGCWCQVGPTDTTKFWVAAGVYDEGNTWAEKTDACRANCPDFCAQLVATDSKFRTKLYGGEDTCPIGTDYKKACCDGEYETEDGTYELCPDGTWCMNCQMNECDAKAMYTATNGATSPKACGTYLHVETEDEDHKIFMRPNAKMTPLALHVNKRGTIFHANMSTEMPNDGKKKHLKTMIDGVIYYIYDNFLI